MLMWLLLCVVDETCSSGINELIINKQNKRRTHLDGLDDAFALSRPSLLSLYGGGGRKHSRDLTFAKVVCWQKCTTNVM